MEVVALQGLHGHARLLRILKNNVCLSAHLASFQRDDVDDGAVVAEEHVQLATQIALEQLVIEVVAIETASCGQPTARSFTRRIARTSHWAGFEREDVWLPWCCSEHSSARRES